MTDENENTSAASGLASPTGSMSLADQVARLQEKQEKHDSAIRLLEQVIGTIRENVKHGKIKTDSYEGDKRLQDWIKNWDERLEELRDAGAGLRCSKS